MSGHLVTPEQQQDRHQPPGAADHRRLGSPPRVFPSPVVFPPVLRQPEPGGVERQDLVAHRATYGPRPDATRQGGPALVAALERSGLTGHGGGHFPVATKWRAALAALAPGESGWVVANCAEGEPASVKDAALLQLRPHLVLDGLALAAETVGTRRAVIWLHEGDHSTEQAVHRAVAERRVNAVLRRAAREGSDALLGSLSDETPAAAAVMHSHPEWIVRLWWEGRPAPRTPAAIWPIVIRLSAAKAVTTCSADFPAARSNERRIVLPSIATIPGPSWPRPSRKLAKQVAKAAGSSSRNRREKVSWLGNCEGVRETPGTAPHGRDQNRRSRRNSRRRKSRRSKQSSTHPAAYAAGRCHSEDRAIRRDLTRSTAFRPSGKRGQQRIHMIEPCLPAENSLCDLPASRLATCGVSIPP